MSASAYTHISARLHGSTRTQHLPLHVPSQGRTATLSPPAQDVPLGQEVAPPSPEHLGVAPCVSLCWAMDEPQALNPGSWKEPLDLENIQGQADGWGLPGEWRQSGVAAPSMAEWDSSTPYLHCTFPV